MPNVLAVAALQLGHPVLLVILPIPHDAAFHAAIYQNREAGARHRPPADSPQGGGRHERMVAAR